MSEGHVLCQADTGRMFGCFGTGSIERNGVLYCRDHDPLPKQLQADVESAKAAVIEAAEEVVDPAHGAVFPQKMDHLNGAVTRLRLAREALQSFRSEVSGG